MTIPNNLLPPKYTITPAQDRYGNDVVEHMQEGTDEEIYMTGPQQEEKELDIIHVARARLHQLKIEGRLSEEEILRVLNEAGAERGRLPFEFIM